jgi:ankyrin repeat protein
MRSGDSALHSAAENGDVLAVKALVKAGADVKKLST